MARVSRGVLVTRNSTTYLSEISKGSLRKKAIKDIGKSFVLLFRVSG